MFVLLYLLIGSWIDVELLGDDSFVIRQEAHVRLQANGFASYLALLRGCRSRDLEIKKRSKMLISILNDRLADFEIQLLCHRLLCEPELDVALYYSLSEEDRLKVVTECRKWCDIPENPYIGWINWLIDARKNLRGKQ